MAITCVSSGQEFGQNFLVAPIGLLDMYNSGGAVDTMNWIIELSECIIKIKGTGCGRFGAYSNIKPQRYVLETVEFLKSLWLFGTAIKELPSSIEHLNGLQELGLSNCKNLEMLPSSICNLSSLEDLYLSNCSKLNKLPDNLGNLKYLKYLRVAGSAVGQLPSSITRLENLKGLYSSECKGLTILPSLSGLCSLTELYVNKCNLTEIPEDIGCLSSLERLEMCSNKFESLPKSIKQLSKLEFLSLRECNMLRSITELPVALIRLEAINCKQLCQALPDASEFKLCIRSKRYEYVNFLFTNSFNLDHKAVSNVFEESLKGSEEPTAKFTIFLPGSEIPNCFSYQSSGSLVNIPVLRQALVNRKFMGFAICAVLGFQEQEFHHYHGGISVGVYCHFETCDDQIGFPRYDQYNVGPVFIDSDHILLGYCSFSKFYKSSQNIKRVLAIADVSDYVDISLEFKAYSPSYKVKCCAVYPIYAEPMEIISATIEDIGETSRKRSGRSDDNEEQVESHPKRICTQPN
ncbi:hypothetical protein LWI29_006466 [Acer saccharum]|uniref:Uncharacterized protein n=1 Tax=Acer saccharum TaxID=4024 RepID=A0AA39SWM5_ACESA|nr:hypothetical protein LWI29_006466 [Acer saccharum]